MRDPNRIYPFLIKLGEYWSAVPDWRFGQFVLNVFESDEASGTHPFYIEDDKMLKVFETYFKNNLESIKRFRQEENNE